MKAIYFPEVNVELGKGQPEYNTLPVHVDKDGVVVACFELDDEEIAQIIKSRKIWIQQLTFRRALQPFALIVVDNYFNSVIQNGTEFIVSKESEVEKQQKLVGRIIPKKGHTIWEVNIKEHTVEPATFEDQAVEFKGPLNKKGKPINKPKSKGLGYVERKDGTKKIVIDPLTPVSKKVIKKKDCIYVSALNKKNLYKKLEKFGLVKIVKAK